MAKLSPISVTKSLVNKQVVAKMKKSCRRVSFNEAQNVEYENQQWCHEDCKFSWYSTQELNTLKDKCYSLAKLIHRAEKEHEGMEASYKNVLLRIYDACCEAGSENASALSHRDQLLLKNIIAKSNSRMGLERVCIREIAHDRRFRRGELLDAVVGIQSCRAGSVRSRTELTRLSSECVSRASRIFARCMAVALADSLGN